MQFKNEKERYSQALDSQISHKHLKTHPSSWNCKLKPQRDTPAYHENKSDLPELSRQK